MNRRAVEKRSLAFLRGEHFVAGWIEAKAGNHLILMLQAERNAKYRVAMRKVCCAVERIDIPAVLTAGVMQALLLAKNIVIRPQAANAFADQNLRFAIGSGNQIGVAFVFNFDVLVEILEQQRARFARYGLHVGKEFVMGGRGTGI